MMDETIDHMFLSVKTNKILINSTKLFQSFYNLHHGVPSLYKMNIDNTNPREFLDSSLKYTFEYGSDGITAK